MTSRLDFDLVPQGDVPDRTRRVLDRAFRSIRNVLDAAHGGVKLREQFAGVVDVVIDTARYPIPVTIPGVKAPPLGVLLLRAIVQRGGTGRAFSGNAIDWEWRGGGLLIHSVTGLAASTRYDATLAVME